MRIGELAQRSGLSRDTIRFYERNGVISSKKSLSETNSYRDYSEDLVIWLEFVSGARDAGLSIADLRNLAEALGGRCNRELARSVIGEKAAELKARRMEIERSLGFLERALERI